MRYNVNFKIYSNSIDDNDDIHSNFSRSQFKDLLKLAFKLLCLLSNLSDDDDVTVTIRKLTLATSK